LVGERAATSASAAFKFGEPIRIEAKGTAEGVVCRRLLGPAEAGRPRVLESTFVGREEELVWLVRAYLRVAGERSPLLVTVIGDAGVGKSSLMRELWRMLSQESAITRPAHGAVPPVRAGHHLLGARADPAAEAGRTPSNSTAKATGKP